MKPFFQLPRFELAWPSFWATLLGLFLVSVGLLAGFDATLIVMGALCLAIGVLIWQEIPTGVVLGFVFFGLLAASHAWKLVFDFQWRSLGYSLGFGSIAYSCWQGFRARREFLNSDQFMTPDNVMNAATNFDPSADDDDSDSPMVSLVLLQRQPKYMESMILAKHVESAWGGDYSNDDEEAADGFVVGDDPVFMIKTELGMFLMHNHAATYWTDVDEVVESITELRLRKAVEDHQAWLSVDFLSASDGEPNIPKAYSMIMSLILELADEDTLAIFRPESMDINVWSDEMAARLLEPDAYKQIAELDNAPVVRVSADDPAMQLAVATAKERWPEFLEAFQNRVSNEGFAIKAKVTVGDSSEFIWIDVVGIEPHYVHVNLANDPVELGDLRLGSRVEVPLEDLCDWCYFVGEQPVGLFTLEAIKMSQGKSISDES